MGALNIAVIISGIDEEYQSTILSGIYDFADEKNLNIVHFIAFGGTLGNQKNDIGEFNIYNLINFDVMDGVILLTNTVSSPKVVNKIVSELKSCCIPVSCIDCDMEEFYYVGIDNSMAMENMVRHIVEDHKIRSVNYITGPDTNPESKMRFDAYKKVLSENGIPFDEDMVYHGMFRERDGVAGVNEFIKNGKLGKAVICANDVMAIGAANTLLENGYSIPDDVSVTGFDNVFNARNFFVPLTSVDRPLKKSGYIACEQVYNAIMGTEQERTAVLETRVCRNQSCGCETGECDAINIFKRETYNILEIYHRDVPSVNNMSVLFAECDDFDDMTERMKEFIEQLDCEKFYLCLCENWLGDDDDSDGETLSEGYTENVIVPLVYCNGNFGKLEKFPTEQVLADLKCVTPYSKRYYFSPIHFNERCLGYTVICNSRFPHESPMYHAWLLSLSNALENIRKKMKLEKVLEKLEALYIYDPLTEIYNRNGFHESADSYVAESIAKNKPVLIMFADMDGMKYINDNFGHKEGDQAIKNMAEAVKNACNDNEVYARFGGDEFIIFGYDYTEEKAEALCSRIRSNIDEYNKNSDKPYMIGASIGWQIDTMSSSDEFNSVITRADQKMYSEKRNKPTSREGRQRLGIE